MTDPCPCCGLPPETGHRPSCQHYPRWRKHLQDVRDELRGAVVRRIVENKEYREVRMDFKRCIRCRQQKVYTLDGGWSMECYGENEFWTCPDCMGELRERP